VEIIRLHNGFGNSSTILTGANVIDIGSKKWGELNFLTPCAFCC
jgi:hypothetical protein